MSVLETTTRWLDETKTTLNEVDLLMKSEHTDENNPSGPSYLNFNIGVPEGKPIKVAFGGNELYYRVYHYSFFQVPQDASIDDSMTTHFAGWVLAYELNGKIHYIINRNSLSKFVLRKLLRYTGKNELRQEITRAYGDLYVWLISKVYSQNNLIENSDDNLPDITINEIRGFKGKTEDLMNTVSAEGPSVMNILSTLSFLIESQNLRQITFDLKYSDLPSLEVMLSTSNTVALNLNEFIAMNPSVADQDILIAKAYLIFYLEILPVVVQNYSSELDAGTWGKDGCVTFLQQVAGALSEKVNARIGDLKDNPDQLIFNTKDQDTAEGEDTTQEV